MKTTIDYLEAAKDGLAITSDRAFGRYFGWNHGAMSDYRAGKKYLSNEHASQLADVLGRNPLELIGAAEAERAKSDEKRIYWANFVKKFAGAGAAMILVLTLAAPMSNNAYSTDIGLHNVKCAIATMLFLISWLLLKNYIKGNYMLSARWMRLL